ncbi:MAG: hypothetical protein ISR51_04995 [Rhodospirillales bacterium]|nr:hypothetical protein [Alphaproteobacteria bacterium]MBL6948014.1 hypothetical protein [Rhodospirillales bacterium]
MTVLQFADYKTKPTDLPSPVMERPQPEPVTPGKTSKEEDMQRLAQATMELCKSSLRQRSRVREFRRETQNLETQINKLEASCLRLDRTVRRIKISPLRRAAINLLGTMETYLENNGGPRRSSLATVAGR